MGNYPFTPPASADNSTDWINVVNEYGADPTGQSDSTTAIQAALTAGLGKTVYIPAGTYLISSTLNPPVSSGSIQGITIRGAGWGTVLQFNQATVSTLIAISGTTQGKVDICDLRIQNIGSADGGTAISMAYFVDSVIDNVSIDGVSGGFHCLNGIIANDAHCFYNEIRACRISVNGAGAIGIAFEGGANSNTAIDPRVLVGSSGGTSSYGIYVNAHSSTIIHPDIENAPGFGVYVDSSGHATTIVNPYLEANYVNLGFGSGVYCPVVSGGTNQTAVSAALQDNGAVYPVYPAMWENSGSLVLSNQLQKVAATAEAGYALVNGTGTVISWTAPNDGNLHRVMVPATLHVSSSETGGAINVAFTAPDGTTGTQGIFSASHGAGVFGPDKAGTVIIEPNTTVSVVQGTALSGGAATLWAEIWAC